MPEQRTVASFLNRARPFLIFSPTDTDPRLARQVAELVHVSDSLSLRDVKVFLFTAAKPVRHWKSNAGIETWTDNDSKSQTDLRRRLGIAPSAFTIVLIGKDGGEKFRSVEPVPADKLFSVIDSMPMRKQEMKAAARK